jgi:hypothetical protein
MSSQVLRAALGPGESETISLALELEPEKVVLDSSAHENLLGFAWQKLSTPLFSTGVASAALALSTPVSFPT